MTKYLLILIISLSFVKTGLSQTNANQQSQKQYNLTLTQQDIQIIYTALLKLTGEVADDVKDKIKTQFTIQNQPQQKQNQLDTKQKNDSIPPKKKQ